MAVPVLLRGIFSIIMLLLSSLFGVFVYGGCFLPLFFVNPKLFRYFFDRMIGTWEYLCVVSIFFYFLGSIWSYAVAYYCSIMQALIGTE